MKKTFLLSTSLCFSVMSAICNAANPGDILQKTENGQPSTAIAIAVPPPGSTPLDQGMQDLLMSLEAPAQSEASYDSEAEYKRHQYVHERFFRRKTHNTAAKKALDLFASELNSNSSYSEINLDGMSARTRIILIREITLLLLSKKERKEVFKVTTWKDKRGKSQTSYESVYPLKFKQGTHTIQIQHKYSPTQPGNALVTINGSSDAYDKIISKINTKKIDWKLIASSIFTNRSQYKGKILSSDYPDLDFLLDFEVARRLIGTKDEETRSFYNMQLTRPRSAANSPLDLKNNYAKDYDAIPVGSAVVGALKLAKDGHVEFHEFLKSDGKYDAFVKQDPEVRLRGIRNIIKTLRKKDDVSKSTKEKVHKEYLEIFGGASESDGDDYDKAIAKSANPKDKEVDVDLDA